MLPQPDTETPEFGITLEKGVGRLCRIVRSALTSTLGTLFRVFVESFAIQVNRWRTNVIPAVLF